jgi:glycerol-3-phosphate O-acyltransferase
MDNYLKSKLLNILENQREKLGEDVYCHILDFFKGYEKICKSQNLEEEKLESLLTLYLELIKKELKEPTQFEIYQPRKTFPVDFYSLAVNLLTPLIDKERSTILGTENIDKIACILNSSENVILFANHQVEADPTILAVLLEKKYPDLIKNMISVAGARVTSDPVTIPFTLGQNVICVYSKKYFDAHLDKKKDMQQHNSSAMVTLKHILDGGGKCIYIAPSGGRDRKDQNGNLYPAYFDPKSIELMRIVGSKSKAKTHFFPLALHTYDVMPPPEKIKKEIGEQRKMCHSPVHIYFGEEISMLSPSIKDKADKDTFMDTQSQNIYQIVTKLYEKMIK